MTDLTRHACLHAVQIKNPLKNKPMSGKKSPVKTVLLGIIGLIVLLIVVIIANLFIVSKTGAVITKGQPIGDYGETRYALLVIDLQESTTGEHSIYPCFRENSEVFIGNVNRVIDTFSLSDQPVIYVRSEITNPLINLLNNAYAKGSPGAQCDKRLRMVSDLQVAKKGKDSFRHTNLDSLLVSHRVNELFVVGLDAAECVKATVEAAQNRQYSVNLIEEAVISASKRSTDSMMVYFRSRGVRVIPLDQLSLTP